MPTLSWLYFKDLNFGFGIDLLPAKLAALYNHPFVVGDVFGNLPGRMVALTFGMVATTYYANIFAPLQVTELRSRLQLFANVCMRVNAFSYFTPIMLAIVWDPHWWPWCAFIGTLFPALNNFVCKKVAETGALRSRSEFSVEGLYETDRFLWSFGEWWLLMGAYSLVIGTIGILLHTGWAKDEAVYAL